MRHNFTKLKIWELGLDLVELTYDLTADFPATERYALSSQMQRCAVSIPSNIAEGTAKSSNKHFVIFLENALGSAYEWETQIIVAHRARYIEREQLERFRITVQELQRKISMFMKSLEQVK